MTIGIAPHPLSFRQVLAHRLFPAGLPAPWEDYYWGRIRTAVFPRQRTHTLSYAC